MCASLCMCPCVYIHMCDLCVGPMCSSVFTCAPCTKMHACACICVCPYVAGEVPKGTMDPAVSGRLNFCKELLELPKQEAGLSVWSLSPDDLQPTPVRAGGPWGGELCRGAQATGWMVGSQVTQHSVLVLRILLTVLNREQSLKGARHLQPRKGGTSQDGNRRHIKLFSHRASTRMVEVEAVLSPPWL